MRHGTRKGVWRKTGTPLHQSRNSPQRVLKNDTGTEAQRCPSFFCLANCLPRQALVVDFRIDRQPTTEAAIFETQLELSSSPTNGPGTGG